MFFPTQKIVEQVKRQYLPGMRVELVKMNDRQAPPIGTRGTVIEVDDVASIIVRWDNGCGLNVAYGADRVKILHHMSDEIFDQILKIRETGKTNMFDMSTVQHMANDLEFYELVIYLEEHRDEYLNFILTGDPAAGADFLEDEKNDG